MVHFAVIIIAIALLPAAVGVVLTVASAILETIGEAVGGVASIGAAAAGHAPARVRAVGALAGKIIDAICILAGLLACIFFLMISGGAAVATAWNATDNIAEAAYMVPLLLGATLLMAGSVRYFWRELRGLIKKGLECLRPQRVFSLCRLS